MKINKKIIFFSSTAVLLFTLCMTALITNAEEAKGKSGMITRDLVSDKVIEDKISESNTKADIFSERTNMLYLNSFEETKPYEEKDMTQYDRLIKEHQQKLKNSLAVSTAEEKNKRKKTEEKLNKKIKKISQEQDSSSEKQNENTVYVNYGDYGVCGAYMGYHMITEVSDQLTWKLSHNWYYDNEGFARFDGRYLLACTTTFGNVGDYVDFHLENGEIVKGIIGDIKWDGDSTYCEFGHVLNNCLNVMEFIVSPDWYLGHENPGTESCHPEWGVKILYAVRI